MTLSSVKPQAQPPTRPVDESAPNIQETPAERLRELHQREKHFGERTDERTEQIADIFDQDVRIHQALAEHELARRRAEEAQTAASHAAHLARRAELFEEEMQQRRECIRRAAEPVRSAPDTTPASHVDQAATDAQGNATAAEDIAVAHLPENPRTGLRLPRFLDFGGFRRGRAHAR